MSKLNILLLITDQQRWDTIEALGNPIIKTPALNSLVEKGVSFTKAYTPCPVCIPARYSMMTGQMPHRTGLTVNGKIPSGRESFMELLYETGYQTYGIGEMSFIQGSESKHKNFGFEYVAGITGSDFKKYIDENGYCHVCEPNGVRSEMYYIPQPSQLPARLHNTAWVIDKSIEFIKNRDTERPFFMMTNFSKPHPPFESPTPWNKLYRGPEMPLPKRPQDAEKLIPLWNRIQNRYKYRDQGIDDNLIRAIKAAYYSAISFIDYNIGRLFEYMRNNGLMENTMIIFMADHGEMLGDYNCFGKRSFFDSAARVPMLLYYPGMKGGKTCEKPVSLIDIFPTIADCAGAGYDEGSYPGDSLMDIASGDIDRNIVFGQYNRDEYAMYMAVNENYKYIYSAPDDKEWLYDSRIDPDETRNRANNPMYSNMAEEMKNKIIEYFKKDGYLAPIEGDDWRHYAVKKMPDDPDMYLLFQDPPSSIPHIPGYEREFNIDHNFIGIGF